MPYTNSVSVFSKQAQPSEPGRRRSCARWPKRFRGRIVNPRLLRMTEPKHSRAASRVRTIATSVETSLNDSNSRRRLAASAPPFNCLTASVAEISGCRAVSQINSAVHSEPATKPKITIRFIRLTSVVRAPVRGNVCTSKRARCLLPGDQMESGPSRTLEDRPSNCLRG